MCHCEMEAFVQGPQVDGRARRLTSSSACDAVGGQAEHHTRGPGNRGAWHTWRQCGGSPKKHSSGWLQGHWAKLPRAASLKKALGWAVVCRDKGQLESQGR